MLAQIADRAQPRTSRNTRYSAQQGTQEERAAHEMAAKRLSVH
jgi:hypothetical protein